MALDTLRALYPEDDAEGETLERGGVGANGGVTFTHMMVEGGRRITTTRATATNPRWRFFLSGRFACFPRTWRLSDRAEARSFSAALEASQRRARATKGRTQPATFILKPADGSEGNGIFLAQV